jgi:uncharacterized protein (TIGR02246 family)
MNFRVASYPLLAIALGACATSAVANSDDDRRIIAALDTAYQAAVERNDADAMAEILHEDMVVVLGTGVVLSRADLLEAARNSALTYEHQVEGEGTQTVRLYGRDTAIVTARLWVKGTRAGRGFEHWLWFSDTYVRTPDGWRYAFGQAGVPQRSPD